MTKQKKKFFRLELMAEKVLTLNLINQPIKIHLNSPMLLSQRIRKRYYKTLETRLILINSPMPPLSTWQSYPCYNSILKYFASFFSLY